MLMITLYAEQKKRHRFIEQSFRLSKIHYKKKKKKKEYWSGLQCLSPGDLPNPGIELVSFESPALQADSLPLSHQRSPYKEPNLVFSHEDPPLPHLAHSRH